MSRLDPQQWAFRALPKDARGEYRKTYLYAFRRVNKAGRHLKLLVLRDFVRILKLVR